MFSTYSSRVAELLQKIESGEIALPDLQRPFVWEDAKVRNLLDSMNKGFPVGYVMLWDFPDDYDAKPRSSAIAKSGTRSVRSLLIDGQQRLTALLSAMDGIVVKDKDYRDRRIRISFNPLATANVVQIQHRSIRHINAMSIDFVFKAYQIIHLFVCLGTEGFRRKKSFNPINKSSNFISIEMFTGFCLYKYKSNI